MEFEGKLILQKVALRMSIFTRLANAKNEEKKMALPLMFRYNVSGKGGLIAHGAKKMELAERRLAKFLL